MMMDWYAATVAPSPAIGGPMCRLRAWIDGDIAVPLREDRAAAALMHAGRDAGVQTRVPTFFRDARQRIGGVRTRAPLRSALLPGYLFIGVPSGDDPRVHGWARDVRDVPVLTGFVTRENGRPARIDTRIVEAIVADAAAGKHDTAREARRSRTGAPAPSLGSEVTVEHPFLAAMDGVVEHVDAEGRVVVTIGGKRFSFAPDAVVPADVRGAA